MSFLDTLRCVLAAGDPELQVSPGSFRKKEGYFQGPHSLGQRQAWFLKIPCAGRVWKWELGSALTWVLTSLKERNRVVLKAENGPGVSFCGPEIRTSDTHPPPKPPGL